MRINISLKDDIVEMADVSATELGLSRSAYIAYLIRRVNNTGIISKEQSEKNKENCKILLDLASDTRLLSQGLLVRWENEDDQS